MGKIRNAALAGGLAATLGLINCGPLVSAYGIKKGNPAMTELGRGLTSIQAQHAGRDEINIGNGKDKNSNASRGFDDISRFLCFSYTSWKDFNNNGYADLDEFIGRDKTTFKIGELMRFALYQKNDRNIDTNVTLNVWDENGNLRDTSTSTNNFAESGMVYDSIAEYEGDWAITWEVNGRHVGTNHFRIVKNN